jgi:hypothetical protein
LRDLLTLINNESAVFKRLPPPFVRPAKPQKTERPGLQDPQR